MGLPATSPPARRLNRTNKFAVKGGDGIDRFRIKIWDRVAGAVIYDNQIGAADNVDPLTTLGGGSIVIHAK